MTYTELQAQIAAYMHRTDLTAQIPQFIALAESMMQRELNLRELDVSVTGTSVNGYITLPADFGSVSRLTITRDGCEVNLKYVDRPDDYSGGSVDSYSQENNKLRLFPSGGNVAYTLYYTAILTPLSNTVPTNWLSVNAPDLYLYASCLECSKWSRDEDQTVILNQTVQPLLDSVRKFSERRTLPQRGNLVISFKRQALI